MNRYIWLCIITAVSAGCVSQPPAAPTMEASIEEGKIAYLMGEYAKACAIFRHTVKNDGGAEASYWLARSLLARGDYAEAEEMFDEASELFEDSFMKAQAMLGAANAAYFNGDYRNAAERYRRLADSFSDCIVMTEVLIRWGKSCQRGGLWDEAERVFKHLRQQAPTLNELDIAEEGLLFCSEDMRFFVVQVGAFGTEEAAKEVAERMKAAGHSDVRVGELSRSGRTIFAVWVGRYKTYREASLALSRIRGAERIEDAIIKP